MNDEVPATLEGADAEGKVVVKGEGTYTVAPDGTVTFVPEKTFTGTGTGVTVKRVDKNGTEATAKYTPTVLPATPTATPAESTGIQGKPQKGLPQFLGGRVSVDGVQKIVPIDETKALELIDPKTGKPSIDENGDSVPVVVKGEGTYKVENGKVVFTPEPQFTGKATGIDVQRVDKNGTPVSAKYTPTVTPVTPTAEGDKSTGLQGKVQTGTPTFTPGNPEVPMDDEVPATFEDGSTVKEVKGVGKYEVAKDGTVTFTPDKSFTGEAPAVNVKRVDKNGTPATATYTPTVTPVTPTGEVSETEGARGAVQKSPVVFDTPDKDNTTVNFNKGNEKVALDKSTLTLVDKDGKEAKEVKVPGEGTYVLKDGVIEFTPEKDFVGKASGVTVQVKDENGEVVSKTYTPTVRPDTKFVVVGKDGKETELIPSKDGEKPSEPVPGYKVAKTVKDKDGNTKHIYEKVRTFFKDKEGKELPNVPSEEGETPKKDNIPGYRFVETKPLPNGDTEHVYEKVTTYFKDKDGNPIKVDGNNKPVKSTEEGDQPKKDIPGYRFVETKKLPNGDVEHVYEKVTPPAPTPTPTVEETTSWVDENGNPIKPSEKGTRGHGEVPGYEFTKTIVDKDGNVRHIFRKVETVTPKAEVKRLANTGSETSNSAAAGFGALIAGIALAVRRRQKNDN